MTHATRARKERGAKIVAIDIYDTETMRQADLALRLRPGTDGALACAVMHILFRDGLADRAYLARYADAPDALEAHLADPRSPWASAITGLAVGQIEEFAALVGAHKRSFFRLGYGFSRQRNGAANMHAALMHSGRHRRLGARGRRRASTNSGVYQLDKTMIEGLDPRDPSVRRLDQSRVGAALTGEAEALKGGGPVKALLIQNTNPLAVAPTRGRCGAASRARTCSSACTSSSSPTPRLCRRRAAGDDVPRARRPLHRRRPPISAIRPKTVEPPDGCRSNHEVVVALAERLGARHPGFAMSPREIIDWTLRASGRGTLAQLEAARWLDCAPPFEEAHFLNGFAHADGRFHFAADWANAPFSNDGLKGPWREMPSLPDHWPVNESADEAHPFKLATSPARNFLNSTFAETATSRAAKRGRRR